MNVQVPYGLPVNTQHQIRVRRGQQLSVPESITVSETIPGIFTKNLNGTGQGLIFRISDYQLGPAGIARVRR